MQMFDDFGEFLEAFKSDPDLAFTPVTITAAHLGVSPAAITGMLKDGRLDGVNIYGNVFVLIKSITDREAKLENETDEVEEYLWDLAVSGVERVFYDPVMQKVGLNWRIPAHRKRIGGILGEISSRSFDEYGVLLSVLVHRKAAGNTNPGPGFFDLAKGLPGFSWNSEDQFVSEQTKAVLKVAKKRASRPQKKSK